MEEKIIIEVHHVKRGKNYDVEIPLGISANDLVVGLNAGLNLGIDMKDISQCYLKASDPIALLMGNRKLSEYGLHHGTKIWFDR